MAEDETYILHGSTGYLTCVQRLEAEHITTELWPQAFALRRYKKCNSNMLALFQKKFKSKKTDRWESDAG